MTLRGPWPTVNVNATWYYVSPGSVGCALSQAPARPTAEVRQTKLEPVISPVTCWNVIVVPSDRLTVTPLLETV